MVKKNYSSEQEPLPRKILPNILNSVSGVVSFMLKFNSKLTAFTKISSHAAITDGALCDENI